MAFDGTSSNGATVDYDVPGEIKKLPLEQFIVLARAQMLQTANRIDTLLQQKPLPLR